ncbi:MAG: hypothetical protein IM631_05075 [Cytophagales bacterium]|nr:hypothetical protein [Cytophagales bacterium]MCA6370753.1 hypothetical protein [Cytophagales bacterium]MCA6385915.1 hypothetical protein [Cytophagales bacterium]
MELPKRDFLNYEEAKIFLTTFKLQTRSEYNILRQSNDEVRRLCPAKPEHHYIDYKSIFDYLSINKTAKKDLPVIVQRKKYLPYSEILRRIRSYGVQSKKEWDELVKKPGEPDDLNVYRDNGFRSYRYLFGGREHINDKYLPYERAAALVRTLDILTSRDYTMAYKEGKLPKTLPASPHVVYRSEWSGWNDFTGGGREMATYEQLKEIVRKVGITSYVMYLEFRERYKGNLRFPVKPAETYKGEFVSYIELFGKKNKYAGLRQVNAKSLMQRVETEIGMSLSSFNDAEVLFILENTAAGRALLLSSMTLDKILDMNKTLDKSPFDLSQGDSAERLGNFFAQLKPRDNGADGEDAEITTDQAVCEVLLSRCISEEAFARNLIRFNRAFSRLGVRYCPVLPVELLEHYIDVLKEPGFYEHIGVGGSILAVERVLTAHRVDAAADIIEKGTVIYTFYVAGIIEHVKDVVTAKGLSCAIYTGNEKSGLDQFISGKRDVLICSRAMSTGYDGLQKRVSKIIIACPMWTSTEYEQFVGRFFRQGSKFSSVSVYRIRIIEKNFRMDSNWDILRWNKIVGKKELLSAVMDGIMPGSVLFDKKKMLKLFRESIGGIVPNN